MIFKDEVSQQIISVTNYRKNPFLMIILSNCSEDDLRLRLRIPSSFGYIMPNVNWPSPNNVREEYPGVQLEVFGHPIFCIGKTYSWKETLLEFLKNYDLRISTKTPLWQGDVEWKLEGLCSLELHPQNKRVEVRSSLGRIPFPETGYFPQDLQRIHEGHLEKIRQKEPKWRIETLKEITRRLMKPKSIDEIIKPSS